MNLKPKDLLETRMQMKEMVITQIDSILTQFQGIRNRSAHDDFSDVPEDDLVCLLTRARAAIHRVAGRPSVYVDQCEQIIGEKMWVSSKVIALAGVIASLKADIEDGYLVSLSALIHGEVFADFLEMSQHLVDEGYKDAAAVIAGSAIEAHLRQLCQISGVETAIGAVPKKADRLNSDLANANVYSKLDQKNVTAWLDLRNKAAHGHFDLYERGQVALLIAGVRDFITRNPA